eukprot:gnl/TRDRNA2_/TRDRNA2_194274_c0_seq1.p1 gnl/TRDRNA2_/TRDRNA2_194274_c0~~gnl/TRDRNA2_/TRDRNA2_194274_c0_seq1.p1  ORF type:complete len:244 (-),score=47.31 gnl/TRDRNA2_/TRDRNA2_194274_c0_seq1:119-787(-)
MVARVAVLLACLAFASAKIDSDSTSSASGQSDAPLEKAAFRFKDAAVEREFTDYLGGITPPRKRIRRKEELSNKVEKLQVVEDPTPSAAEKKKVVNKATLVKQTLPTVPTRQASSDSDDDRYGGKRKSAAKKKGAKQSLPTRPPFLVDEYAPGGTWASTMMLGSRLPPRDASADQRELFHFIAATSCFSAALAISSISFVKLSLRRWLCSSATAGDETLLAA